MKELIDYLQGRSLETIVTILTLLGSTITFLTKYLKSAKAKRIAEQLVKLTNQMIPLIEEAEKLTNYSGLEKKEYVMTKTLQWLMKTKVKISPEVISQKIEALVDLTKQVNITKTSRFSSAESTKELGVLK